MTKATLTEQHQKALENLTGIQNLLETASETLTPEEAETAYELLDDCERWTSEAKADIVASGLLE